MRGRPHPITQLARTRPYTARKRVLEVIRECGGQTPKIANVLGMSRRAACDLIARLGLAEERRRVRAAIVADNRARHQLGWSLYGTMYALTPEGRAKERVRKEKRRAAKAAAKAAAKIPTGGTR